MAIGVQLGIPGIAELPATLPRAAKLQRTVSNVDAILVQLARNQGRNVLWWWGIRHPFGSYYAVCYVCNHVITRGGLNWHITDNQQTAIDAHRRDHWVEVDSARTITTRPL